MELDDELDQDEVFSDGFDSSSDSDDLSNDEYEKADVDGSDDEDKESDPQSAPSDQQSLGTAFGDALNRILTKDLPKGGAATKNIRSLENYKLEKKIQAKLKEQKRKKYERFHILPAEFSPLSEEKRLMKVSRKGVVKLFNAVNAHKKTVTKELDSKKKPLKSEQIAQLSKEKFFEILQQQSDIPMASKILPSKKETTIAPASSSGTTGKWSVFSDDYLLKNQKLRDWDKQIDEEREMEEELEGELVPADYQDNPYDDW